MEWDTFADLPPLEAANPPLLHPPPQPHNPPPLPPPANRAPSASLPTQSSAAVAIPAVVRGVSALSSASSASGTGSPSRRHKGGRSLATSATSSSSSSSSSSSHSSASDNSDDERRERRKSKKKKNKKRREKEKEKERERDREKQQQQRDRSASPAPNPDVTAALDGMTKAMRLLAATTQRTSSGNTSGSSSSKSKKRDKDRAREKDNKRNKKDKRRSSTPPPTTASAASSSNKNRNRPSSRNNQPTLPANGITTAITATHQPAQPPLPAYLGEYERVVRRLAEEERALLAAQRRLEAEVRSELDKRRKRREQKQGEEKADELNFVARFLLNGTSKGGAALRRPAEEKERERERRQRGLPMYGSDADERDADEEDDDDESSHEEEDEDEEEERKRRKAQRLQRRRERREAKEAREAAERARIDQQLVDETIPFIQALSMQPTTASHDDHREVVEERKEVAEAKVKEERVVVKAEERKEAGEEEDVMGRPLLDGVKPDEQQLFEQPPPSTFDGIEQDAWEQRIVYDDQQLKAEDEHKQEQQAAQARRQRAITALKAEPVTTTTAATASSASSPLSFSSFSLPSLSSSFSAASDSRPSVQLTWLKSASAADRARMRYMGLERVNPAQFTVAAVAAAQPSTTAVVSRGRSEWKGVVVQPLNETAKGGVVLGERLLSHHINQSLLTNDWLAAIIYDESDLTTNHNHLLSHNALLLDQNDTQLFLPPTHTLTHLANHTHTPQPPLTDQYGRYNISHDSAAGWGGGGDGQLGSLRVLKILHASFAANLDPLVYRTHLTSAELAHYHRPLLSLPADVATTMAVKAEGASGAGGGAGGEEREQARYVPRSMEELSASDGDIIVCEYLERHPPLLMNVGMCSQLITYYRKQSDLDIHEPSALDGDVVVLTTKDGSPFLSQLRPGQTVTALTNNMYIAPVVRHVPTPHTFLLMRVVGANYWTVRSLPSGCYVVGQEEPKLSVPYPDRSHAYDLLKKQLEVFIYKRLRSNQRRISANDIGREFGHSVVVDTIARRVLKDLGTLDRSRNEWTLRAVERPSEEKLQLLCTPEDVCCYEAMRAADSRLKESGVRRFTNVKAISDIIDQLTQDDVSRVAIYIEKQLHLMPWTLTKGFLAAKDGKGTLRLTGRGNPFAEGCGFSYINEKVTAKKTSTDADHFPELQEPKKKTGTNADLRKLTMDEMGAALQKLGMGADEVAKLLRWDRVRAIARLSMEAVQEGKYPNLKRFARQARPTSAKMMEEYRRDIAAIFDRQLAMLAWSGRPDYSHEVDDDVAAVKEKGGARKVRERQGGGGGRSEFLAAKKKEREEEEEYKEFLASREKALKSDQNTANKPTDRSKLTTTTANSLKPTTINSPNTTATTAAPATPALAGATPPTTAAAPGKKKKKVLITKLQHVIKVTNKDGSQTVHTKMYSDKDTLRDFVLDCQSAYTESSSNGQRLRQRLQLNSLPALEGGTGGKKGDGKEGGKGGKEEDEDDEGGERQLKGVPQVELIPITGISKIKTLDAYLAKYTKAGRQHAASAAADKARTRWKGGGRGGGGENVEWMFTLDDDDWNRAGDPFRFPPDASPSAGGAGGHSAGGASLLTSTSSGTLKLSLKQLHQTPQDVYVKSKMKRKLTASDTEPSSTSSLMQPYKKKVLSRRRGDPRIFLSSCLEDILNVVSEFDYAAPFREPVTDDIAEDYADVIHNPMDLKTIKNKCSKMEYDNKEEFLEDVTLMRTNCETYNGHDALISEHARLVEEDVRAMLASDTYRQRIDDSEAAIEQHQLLTRLDACVGQLAMLRDAGIFAKTPDWPEYVERVEVPLALDTLRERVEGKLYTAVGEFMWDVQQMWENSVTYNGKDHMVTQRAEGMINRAREYLLKWYTRVQLEPSDALVQRLKKEKDAAGSGAALAGRGSTGTAGTSTPALSYHPSSRTPNKHAAGGAAATPGPTVLASPGRASMLASPQLQVGGVEGGAGTAASPRMSPSPLRADSPAMLTTLQISAGETSTAAGRSALRTPALSSSVASPLLSMPSAASTPSASSRPPRSDRDPSPFSTAHLPAFAATPSASSASPSISSSSAFLPSSSSSPSVLSGGMGGVGGGGGMGGMGDDVDVLSGFGDMDAMFGAGDAMAMAGVGGGMGGGDGDGVGVGDLDMGLGGLGGMGGIGEEDGMALEDLPPPMEDGGERKDGEDEIDIWN